MLNQSTQSIIESMADRITKVEVWVFPAWIKVDFLAGDHLVASLDAKRPLPGHCCLDDSSKWNYGSAMWHAACVMFCEKEHAKMFPWNTPDPKTSWEDRDKFPRRWEAEEGRLNALIMKKCFEENSKRFFVKIC